MLVFGGSEGEPGVVPVESRVPVVMVIFDELPLSSLLDSSGRVLRCHPLVYVAGLPARGTGWGSGSCRR